MMRHTALALVISAALVAITPAHAQAVSASDASYTTAQASAPDASYQAAQASQPAQPLAAPLPAVAVPAPFNAAAAPAPLAAGDLLQPGEFRWLGRAEGAGSLVIMVSLADQRATVFRNGQAIAVTTVSTGMPGRETPTGVYPILAKEKMHHSNLYDNAPMPFMQRLTWSGVALHAGRIPGRPASHGCVRLPKQFAQQLFSITERGQSVIISDDASVDALLRVGVPELLAGQIGRRSDSLDAGYDATAGTDAADSAVDAGSVSYQDTGGSAGGSPK